MIQPDEPLDQPSSPACALHELSDTYLGYASAEEVDAVLATILRGDSDAGARLTALIPRLRDPAMRAALRDCLDGGLVRTEIVKALVTAPRP